MKPDDLNPYMYAYRCLKVKKVITETNTPEFYPRGFTHKYISRRDPIHQIEIRTRKISMSVGSYDLQNVHVVRIYTYFAIRSIPRIIT